MKKERIVIILIVLIIGGFFLVKSIKSDSIALSNNNILNETKKEDKINNVVQYQEDSKTNITNENIKMDYLSLYISNRLNHRKWLIILISATNYFVLIIIVFLVI